MWRCTLRVARLRRSVQGLLLPSGAPRAVPRRAAGAEVRRGRQLAPVVDRGVRTHHSSCGGSCSWYTTSTRTRWRIGGKRRRSYVRYLGISYVKEQPSSKATWDEAIQVGMWRNVTVMDRNRDEHIYISYSGLAYPLLLPCTLDGIGGPDARQLIVASKREMHVITRRYK